MAGGKETPRQKMIGMMYLVLTALLALNVSKQIVAAFITLNDKIDRSATSLDTRIDATYTLFDQKGATLRAEQSDLRIFELWNSKAENLKKSSSELVSFLLSECNEMIKVAEGKDWIEMKDESGNITKLKSLDEIENMDDYDIPTNMFVGGNPSAPNGRGVEIVTRIHQFRNEVANAMGTYYDGDNLGSFKRLKNWKNFHKPLKQRILMIRQAYRNFTNQ
jgi:gliding motility-associated protein GldM